MCYQRACGVKNATGMTDQIFSLVSVYSKSTTLSTGGGGTMVLAYHSVRSLCTFFSPSCTLLRSNKKPLGSLFPPTSARMGLLVVVMAATLAAVHGFGLGPSLEWKAGDAEMWNQVHLLLNSSSFHVSLQSHPAEEAQSVRQELML